MTISIQISGNTTEELQEAIRAVAAAFGGTEALHSRLVGVLAEDNEPAKATLVVAKPRTNGVPPEPDTQPEVAGTTTGTPEEPVPETKPEPAQIAANVKKELTPAEMRAQGSDMLMQLFNRDPSRLADLKSIQTKYGVKKFSEIPDDKAQAFYADAMLVANGTGEVAA